MKYKWPSIHMLLQCTELTWMADPVSCPAPGACTDPNLNTGW